METRVLIVRNGQIVEGTDNINEYIGVPFESAIANLLWNPCKNTFIGGKNLYQFIAAMDNKIKGYLPGWNVRYIDKNSKIPPIYLTNKKRGIRNVYVKDIKYDIGHSKNKRQERRVIQILNTDLIWDRVRFRNAYQELEAILEYLNLHKRRGIPRIRESKGAAATAFLKASPDWEDKRHASPKFINECTRPYLPGNFYSRSQVSKETSALNTLDNCYLIDQISSHHSIAIDQIIPHPHHIRARGFYRQAETKKEYYPIWSTPKDRLGQCLMLGHYSGLVFAKVHCGTLPPTKEHLYPVWAKKRGTKYIWLWTPELRLFLHDHRLQLDSFVAAFTTTINDPAITEYGKWSLDYLENHTRNKKYSKGVLLAAYGMLAFNQERYGKSRRYYSDTKIRGNQAELPIAGIVSERVIQFKQDIQHPVINLIARGVIESETMMRTLEYAKELDEQGYHVCQTYVDGIVLQSTQIPFPREGWRIDASIPNYFAIHDAWIQGDGIHKTPGIPITEEELRSVKSIYESRRPIVQDREQELVPL